MTILEQDATAVVLCSLAVAAAVVVVRAAWVWRELHYGFFTKMGAAKWDIQSSWASNLTAVGAIATTILTSSDAVFKDKTPTVNLAKSEYIGLSLLFGALIVVGAFLYNSLRVADWVDTGPNERDVQYQGFVSCFLVTCALTLWAVLGQLWLVYLLVGEAHNIDALDEPSVIVFRTVLLVGAVAAIIYVFRSLRDTVQFQAEPANDEQLVLRNASMTGLSVAEFKRLPADTQARNLQQHRPLHTWTLL